MFERLQRWRADRREALMRAPDYALYLRKLHGSDAEAVALEKAAESARWSYRWMLYRETRRQLRARPVLGTSVAPK